MKLEKKIKIIVGCEESQAATIAFRAMGHEAYSCDLKPCSGGRPEWHLQMDVFKAIGMQEWDMGIFFPDCTYLTGSAEWAFGDGPYHQKVKPETLVGEARRRARIEAAAFFMALYNCKIKRVAIENPIGAMSRIFRKPDQIFNPYNFGDDASKKTCLWLKGLPPLLHTGYFPPRMVDGRPRWGNQTDSGQNKLPPSANRAELRSKTYPGIAAAMANQWGQVHATL
jgi:hypothetical protein